MNAAGEGKSNSRVQGFNSLKKVLSHLKLDWTGKRDNDCILSPPPILGVRVSFWTLRGDSQTHFLAET